MIRRSLLTVAPVWLVLALFLAACQSAAPAQPEPVAAVATTVAPSPTPAPTAVTEPLPPTPLPAPVVVEATTAPTAVPETAAPEVVESAPPLTGLIGPDFPDNVNPLTGATVSDPAVLQRRPLAIKISNYPEVVRPQSGLNSADLVFEHYAEGGVTRFTAVYYGQDAEPVGSVRSGRLIDLEIPKMYDAAFAYSGASGPVRLEFRDSPFYDRIISPDFGHDGFYRVPDPNKAFEHTLFTDTYFLRNILNNRGLNTPPNFANGMVFSAESIPGGTQARTIDVAYDSTNAYWEYNSATGRYARWTDGIPLVDPGSGQPVTFKNVVAVAANHVNTLIIEDALGSRSIEIQVWGEGPASIFRDGMRYDGRWLRADPNHMLTFVDEAGNPIPLAVGNTFFQVVPLGFTGLTVRQ